MLFQGQIKSQVKIAILQFLTVWLEGCPNAVGQFLGNPKSAPYLITQVLILLFMVLKRDYVILFSMRYL